MPSKTVFVTYASEDARLARLLVELVVRVVSPTPQVFCASVPGHDIPAGIDYVEFIRTRLDEASVSLAVVTPAGTNGNDPWRQSIEHAELAPRGEALLDLLRVERLPK